MRDGIAADVGSRCPRQRAGEDCRRLAVLEPGGVDTQCRVGRAIYFGAVDRSDRKRGRCHRQRTIDIGEGIVGCRPTGGCDREAADIRSRRRRRRGHRCAAQHCRRIHHAARCRCDKAADRRRQCRVGVTVQARPAAARHGQHGRGDREQARRVADRIVAARAERPLRDRIAADVRARCPRQRTGEDCCRLAVLEPGGVETQRRVGGAIYFGAVDRSDRKRGRCHRQRTIDIGEGIVGCRPTGGCDREAADIRSRRRRRRGRRCAAQHCHRIHHAARCRCDKAGDRRQQRRVGVTVQARPAVARHGQHGRGDRKQARRETGDAVIGCRRKGALRDRIAARIETRGARDRPRKRLRRGLPGQDVADAEGQRRVRRTVNARKVIDRDSQRTRHDATHRGVERDHVVRKRRLTARHAADRSAQYRRCGDVRTVVALHEARQRFTGRQRACGDCRDNRRGRCAVIDFAAGGRRHGDRPHGDIGGETRR